MIQAIKNLIKLFLGFECHCYMNLKMLFQLLPQFVFSTFHISHVKGT